jgi:steroid delta-isomerase-like uncharacterized protein
MTDETETAGTATETEAATATEERTSDAEALPRAKRPGRSKDAGAASRTEETARLVGEYFEAVASDPDTQANAQARYYAEDAQGVIAGTMAGGRQEIIDYFTELRSAFPDFSLEVIDLIAQDDRAAVHWRCTGTFAGSTPYQGIEPNGARIDIKGVDFVRVRDGRLVRNDAYPDNMSVARQLGLLPPQGSRAEKGMFGAFNARTRLARRVGSGEPEPVADGVWLVRGGFPMKTMNVYLIRDGDGVMLFDAGIRGMTRMLAAVGLSMGGITRVLLGHGHADHRGAAAGLGVPVLCHEAERADAEGDGGAHYMDPSQLNPLGRLLLPRMIAGWDGGPVPIAGTVKEGDDVAGFRVIHLPGHAPGMIGLWREADRVALSSDCFYTLDPQTGRKGAPRLPHRAFNYDTDQARRSIRKLAEMEPSAAWPGHADPVTGDVRAALERAAATT